MRRCQTVDNRWRVDCRRHKNPTTINSTTFRPTNQKWLPCFTRSDAATNQRAARPRNSNLIQFKFNSLRFIQWHGWWRMNDTTIFSHCLATRRKSSFVSGMPSSHHRINDIPSATFRFTFTSFAPKLQTHGRHPPGVSCLFLEIKSPSLSALFRYIPQPPPCNLPQTPKSSTFNFRHFRG